MQSDIKLLSLSVIHRSSELQARVELNQEHVSELREVWRLSVEISKPILPAVVVFKDGQGTYWLADGFHRCYSAYLEGIEKVNCDVRLGDARAALLYAIGANKTHGLKRTHGDKRKAVLMILNDLEWQTWTQDKIAKHCGVDQGYVSKIKAQLISTTEDVDDKSLSSVTTQSEERIVSNKDGKTYRVIQGRKQLPTLQQQLVKVLRELKTVLSAMGSDAPVDLLVAVNRSLDTDSATIAQPSGQSSQHAL